MTGYACRRTILGLRYDRAEKNCDLEVIYAKFKEEDHILIKMNGRKVHEDVNSLKKHELAETPFEFIYEHMCRFLIEWMSESNKRLIKILSNFDM